MTDLPTELIIGPYRLKVLRDDAALFREGTDATLEALVNMHSGLVVLREDRPGVVMQPEYLGIDLVHETLHAILDVSNRMLAEENPKETEKFVEAMSAGVYLLIRDNPSLVEYIWQRPVEEEPAPEPVLDSLRCQMPCCRELSTWYLAGTTCTEPCCYSLPPL